MQLPQLVPVFNTAKQKYENLLWGCAMEPDPNLPGYARLKVMEGAGSVCRQGKGYVAFGAADVQSPVTVPAAGQVTVQFREVIQEYGWIGYLYLYGVPVTPTVYVTNLSRNGDSLMNGNVPATMFQQDSVYNPVHGHFVNNNTSLDLILRNTAAVAITIGSGFSLL